MKPFTVVSQDGREDLDHDGRGGDGDSSKGSQANGNQKMARTGREVSFTIHPQ